MKSVGVFEGKTRFSALVADAQSGQTTIITRNGKPVAQIGPISVDQKARAREAVQRIRALRARLAAEGKLHGINVRELIDEGRK